MKKVLIVFLLLLSASCSKAYDEDDDDIYSTKPVTNNPQIVPQHGSALPMVPQKQHP